MSYHRIDKYRTATLIIFKAGYTKANTNKGFDTPIKSDGFKKYYFYIITQHNMFHVFHFHIQLLY